ncbi:MAG: DedA family protein [Pseudomonadales bacterium]|jgi:membrane-associated protein|nr:DedA family protein [Pseudomonadales bacterium]
MAWLPQLFDMLLHLDATLGQVIADYGTWVYAILFLIIFCETGLVVLPFLPGDSLLFVAGAFAATGALSLPWLLALLCLAAIVGNTVNYAVGSYLGPRVFQWPDSAFFNRAALDRAHRFYEQHGGKTLVITRFMPILRTFTPFVAGISAMNISRFQCFNIAGALLWVISLTLAGYLFGNVPFVKNNLTLVILVIIALSLLPAVIAWWKSRGAHANVD